MALDKIVTVPLGLCAMNLETAIWRGTVPFLCKARSRRNYCGNVIKSGRFLAAERVALVGEIVETLQVHREKNFSPDVTSEAALRFRRWTTLPI